MSANKAKESKESVASILGGTGETEAPESGLSKKDLAFIASLVSQAVEAATSKSAETSARVLADAILESRKPYRDPKQDQNDEAFRKSSRELEKRIRENMKASQELCPHKQGCNDLSESQSQLSSFVTHRLDTGLVWGICTNCQKQIFSNVPEHGRFFKEKSGNRMSSAGIRTFNDPRAVQKAGMPFVDEPEVAAVALK